MSTSLPPHGLQLTGPPCLSLSLTVCSNSYPLIGDAFQPSPPLLTPSPPDLNLSQHQGIFHLFASGGQSIGASASLSVFPMNIHGWFPLGFPGLISFLLKGLSRVFSSTTVQKHQFLGTQPSLWPNSHICTRPHDYTDLCQQSNISAF